MLPTARITHQMQGRLRIRIPDRRRDDGYFDQVRDQLSRCEGVDSVSVNPLSASALVIGHVPPDEVVSFARRAELFEMDNSVAQWAPPLSDRVANGFEDADVRLRGATQGHLDLSGLALIGLVGASLWQLTRRRVLPEALTILYYAASLAARPMAGPRAGG